MIYTSNSALETQQIARELILRLVNDHQGRPIVVALEGDLGAGKTTFVQGLIASLDITEKVKSPTFVLMKEYDIPANGLYSELYHLDCYRLNNAIELIPLGVGDILVKPNTIILIEWAERVKDILPAEHIIIRFDHVSEHVRNIKVGKLHAS